MLITTVAEIKNEIPVPEHISAMREIVTLRFDEIIFDEGLYPRVAGHDPDTLNPLDLRNHHATNFKGNMTLSGFDVDEIQV